jgi:hypothetical protein
MPGWRCFQRQFLPNCPLISEKSFLIIFTNVAYPGRVASRRIISSRFVWCGLSSDVSPWAHGCLACQWGKIHRHTRLVQPIPISQRRFSHLHVDLVGPLQYSNNFNYIFTIIDRTSKWMESALRFARLQTPRLAACVAAADRRAAAQVVLLQPSGSCFRPAGFFTFSFICASVRQFQNRFPTRRGGFCTPGTGVPSQPP